MKSHLVMRYIIEGPATPRKGIAARLSAWDKGMLIIQSAPLHHHAPRPAPAHCTALPFRLLRIDQDASTAGRTLEGTMNKGQMDHDC
jgi:hypothetical protein